MTCFNKNFGCEPVIPVIKLATAQKNHFANNADSKIKRMILFIKHPINFLQS